MKLSVFTPSHNTKFLEEAYKSIKDQPFDEWVILLNNGAESIRFLDERVKVFYAPIDTPPYVGALKKMACELVTGDILLELDHDDLLLPGAVEKVKKVFAENSDVGFVYSNCVEMNMDGTPRERYSEDYGWRYRSYDNDLSEYVAFAPTPASVSRIWYAPNHLRAFRRDVYNLAGGYDATMRVLDDQDLMSRMYQVASFKHIDEPLYIYRVHGDNAWLQYNKEIQDNVYRLYDQYIEDLCLTWAKREGFLSLDLGGRFHKDPRYVSVDLKGSDETADLNYSWPFPDGSVGLVRANDVFEHLVDPIHTMRELYRVLTPGGYALIRVPSTDGRGAFQDPTHKSFWNENSFLYYTDRRWAKYIDTPVRFQATRLYTTKKNDIGVCWAVAHLVKLTDGLRVPGLINI